MVTVENYLAKMAETGFFLDTGLFLVMIKFYANCIGNFVILADVEIINRAKMTVK